MSQAPLEPAMHAGPEDPSQPQPPQDPTHDVPVYPEHDPPPDRPVAAPASGSETDQPVQGDEPGDGHDDVDEDDLDPRVPHSPPDAGKDRVLFDENKVAG